MGAGILPTAVHGNKLYFLFGKENQYADTPGWSDFGGGTDNKESYFETACREGEEELTGFLGNKKEIEAQLKKRPRFFLDNKKYRMFFYPMEYDPSLPRYYNNNHRFLEERLSPTIIKREKIFEKEEIRWVSFDELTAMRPHFRSYFNEMVDKIIENKKQIHDFIMKKKKTTTRKTRKSRDNVFL
jgi:8-oxo-dGTP pyrophosphatase MutT (NUDIX family)